MFAYRNLEVMSWSGFNILGNLDGQVLNNPGNKESKIRTKDQVLSKVLGYSPHSTWASTTCRRSTIRKHLGFHTLPGFLGRRCRSSSCGRAMTRSWPRRWCWI